MHYCFYTVIINGFAFKNLISCPDTKLTFLEKMKKVFNGCYPNVLAALKIKYFAHKTIYTYEIVVVYYHIIIVLLLFMNEI